MIGMVVFIIFLIFVVLSTQTLLFHPRSRKDILTTSYSSNKDFWLKNGNSKLLIMLHGMYSSPATFEQFAQLVHRQDWDVYAPVLPNSSNSVDELKDQPAFLWEDSLRVAFQKIIVSTENYKDIVLCGHSQGGSIALTLAPSLVFLKAVAVVAAPMHLIGPQNSWLRNIGIFLSGFLYFLLPKHGMDTPVKYQKERAFVEDTFGSEGFYYGLTLHSMNLGLAKTRKQLHLIKQPLFLAYEKGDRITDFDDFLLIKRKVESSFVREIVFDTPRSEEPYSKRHKLFSYKPVKDKLFCELSAFLREIDEL